MLTKLNQPVIFAHRGASAHAPENTLAAFNLALEQGADAIELDAKLTTDGEVIVIHDQTVNRTTNGSGEVKRYSLDAIRKLDAGSFWGPEFAGEKIPTLAEVFESVGKKLYINVELTNYATPRDALPEKVGTLVKEFGLENWVMFSSFNPFNLSRVRSVLPGCPVGMLALEGGAGRLARGWFGRWFAPNIVHPFLADATSAFIRQEHGRGRRVHVWTVNDESDMRRLFADGVDGIFTDDPALARRIREEK